MLQRQYMEPIAGGRVASRCSLANAPMSAAHALASVLTRCASFNPGFPRNFASCYGIYQHPPSSGASILAYALRLLQLTPIACFSFLEKAGARSFAREAHCFFNSRSLSAGCMPRSSLRSNKPSLLAHAAAPMMPMKLAPSSSCSRARAPHAAHCSTAIARCSKCSSSILAGAR